MGLFGKKHHPKLLKTQRISYSDLFFTLRLSRGDLMLRPIFIVASVELGNSTTKTILSATDLKSGKTYILDKAIRMTREALAHDAAFCHTITMVELSEASIAELVCKTLHECTSAAGISTPDLHFVVRSSGVTAGFSSVEEMQGVIRALASGCMLAGIPPRKMISPMTVNDIHPDLRKFSRMEKTYFDGAVTSNEAPAGESLVANEMEGELVTAGLKEAAKWLDVDYRNPVLSLDFGTTLAGRVTDDQVPYSKVTGSFCGLAGAIPDAFISHIVPEKYPSVLDCPQSNLKRKIKKDVVKSYAEDVLRHLRIEKIMSGTLFGGSPVNVDVARKDDVTLIGVDAGDNLSDLPKIAEIGADVHREESMSYVMAVIDEVAACVVEELVGIAKEEGLVLPNTKIGITGRAGITRRKPEIILEKLSDLLGRNMDKEVIFADDALARGAAVLGRCMHQFGSPGNPIGGTQGSGCIAGKRMKRQKGKGYISH
jgi:putative methanogenesis marker protein 14